MSGLVAATGVGAATVRYYLAEGLLPPPLRVAPNRFVYDERHVEVLRLIRLLRARRRLPLDAIRRLLPEMLPDLLGTGAVGVFRPEMWRQLLSAEAPSAGGVGARLIEEGLAAFCTRGYYEVSIDDVCRAVGIAKGSFYRYFASKEELLLAVAAAAAERLASDISAGLAGGKVPGRLLAEALAPYRTLVLELASLSVRGREPHGRALDELLERVAGAIAASGELDPEAARELLDGGLAALLRSGPAEAVRVSLTAIPNSTRMDT